MSYRDFEDLKNTKIRNTNKLDYIANNLYYLYDFVCFLKLDQISSILNRHVFKFTRLREEIIFLTVRLSNSSGYGSKSIIKLAVNEKSFWNRFIISKPTGERYNKFEYDTIQMLQFIKAHSPSIGTIRLRLTYEEKQKIARFIEFSQPAYKDQLRNMHLVDDSIVEVLDVTHYSKLTWCYLFNNFVTKYPASELHAKLVKNNKSNIDLGEGLFDYKTSGAEGFYDPTDLSYSDYRKFYELPYVFEIDKSQTNEE